MHRITEVEPLDDYVLKIKFRNGDTRLLDMKPSIERGGVFEVLRDAERFREVQIQKDLGGLAWPSGADFCPNTAHMRSKPYESLRNAPKSKKRASVA
jgi:hypothetical protein